MINLVTKRSKPVPNIKFSEDDLIKGLKNGDGQIISFIYKRNMPAIRNMINQYSNMVLDADDVIQEGLTRTIMNLRDGKYRGTSSIHTYLYSVCKNICLKEYQKSKIYHPANPGADFIDEHEDDYFDLLQAVLKIKKQLEEKCIEIIDLRFSLHVGQNLGNDPPSDKKSVIMPFEEIALKLDILPDNARQRFKRCLEKLISAVKQEKLIDEYF